MDFVLVLRVPFAAAVACLTWSDAALDGGRPFLAMAPKGGSFLVAFFGGLVLPRPLMAFLGGFALVIWILYVGNSIVTSKNSRSIWFTTVIYIF